MSNKDILSQAEIDALLSPMEDTEETTAAADKADQLRISTVIERLDHSLLWKKGDFIALTGDLFDVLVNGTLVAQGEMIAIDDKLGIRLTEVVNKTSTE